MTYINASQLRQQTINYSRKYLGSRQVEIILEGQPPMDFSENPRDPWGFHLFLKKPQDF